MGVRVSFQGRRHSALSISRRSPMVKLPRAPRVKYMASLIRRPLMPFIPPTFFHKWHLRSRSRGNSSRTSRLRHSFKLSDPPFLLPPGNVQRPSRRRLTSKTRRPSFAATTSLAALGFRLIHPPLAPVKAKRASTELSFGHDVSVDLVAQNQIQIKSSKALWLSSNAAFHARTRNFNSSLFGLLRIRSSDTSMGDFPSLRYLTSKGVRVIPVLSFQCPAIDGQLIVRTCHRSGKSNAHLCDG